jgi:hypothetical protein
MIASIISGIIMHVVDLVDQVMLSGALGREEQVSRAPGGRTRAASCGGAP